MRSNLREPGNTTAISDNNADHVSRGSLGGTDFKDGYGTPVHAQLDGVVTIVDNSPDGSGGRYSRVTGNDGGGSVESLHQSSVTAYRGMPTDPETVIGVSGASAYGSNYGTGGPHIHNHGVPIRNLEPYYWFLNGGTSTAAGSNTTPFEEDDMFSDTDRQALNEARWLLGQIKPQTDKLDRIAVATDLVLWSTTDPSQGIRRMIANLSNLVGQVSTRTLSKEQTETALKDALAPFTATTIAAQTDAASARVSSAAAEVAKADEAQKPA